LQHVFDSLTDNGKGVLKLIIKEQIEQIKQRKDGPNFKGMQIFDIFENKFLEKFLLNQKTTKIKRLILPFFHHFFIRKYFFRAISVMSQKFPRQFGDGVKSSVS